MTVPVYITDPHQAELNAQRVMRDWGYSDAKATTGGADGGIDVRSRSALAQVKWKGGVTGRPDVQNLYGARAGGAQALFFFSASGFSKEAVGYADANDIRLFIYDPAGQMSPISKPARFFIANRRSGPVVAHLVLNAPEIALALAWTVAMILGIALLLTVAAGSSAR